MQGGEPDPGRGVYVARRIVAAFILLLLLVLLVPWACQALFPERDSGPKAPETAVTDENPATEQASAPDNSSGGEVDEGAAPPAVVPPVAGTTRATPVGLLVP